jgi:hypothetical protein
MQTSACFKKEIMAFFRTKKFLVLFCVFVGVAVLIPLMFGATASFMESAGELDMIGAMLGALTMRASDGLIILLGNLFLVGLILYLLLINSFAGGEQKKRAIIIPRSAGLRAASYITPKFIVYPLSAFVLTMFAVLLGAAVSSSVFKVNDLVTSQVLAAGALLGVNLMMYTCFHLCIGTATGQAGASAAICIGFAVLVPDIFELISRSIDGDLIAYNPFALATMSMEAVAHEPNTGEMAVTVIFSFALMFISYLLAVFAQNAKRIDNKGNEMVI